MKDFGSIFLCCIFPSFTTCLLVVVSILLWCGLLLHLKKLDLKKKKKCFVCVHGLGTKQFG